jgi:hypothetical protein
MLAANPLTLKNLKWEIKETGAIDSCSPQLTTSDPASVKQVLATHVASISRGDGAVAGLLSLIVLRNGDTVQIRCAIAAYIRAQEGCVNSSSASSRIDRTVR